jgi:hypothetical protein
MKTPRPSTDQDLNEFARAMQDLLNAMGAVRSYPINPSRADFFHAVEMAIRKMVKEELDRTGRYPL